MKVAVEWLRSFGDFESLNDKQLSDTLTMAGLEVEEITGADSETVFVTKVTPNRGDWLSIFGVARETSAASGLPLHAQSELPSHTVSEDISGFTVNIAAPELCSRFAAAELHDLQIVPSPQFIQDRLILSGMRPLNIVVDVTNYVMLEIGQPLHAYDKSKLSGNRIIVRPAESGESIKTLDGAVHDLTNENLVIADARQAIGIAGIMGGFESEVSPTTTSIILESAHFDAGVVRRGAKQFGYSTEASFRFERYVDPALVPIALTRAIELLKEFAHASIEPTIIDNYPSPTPQTIIPLRTSRTQAILGLPITSDTIGQTLNRLGMSVFGNEELSHVTVPSFRPDLVKEIDLIEEVGRIIGYWNLPESIPAISGEGGGDFERGEFESKLRTLLVGQGLIETYSHTLGSDSYFDPPTEAALRVNVRSSLSSELTGLRVNLLPHLLDAAALNLRHGISSVRLFETGKVFRRSGLTEVDESRHVAGVVSGIGSDFGQIKGVVENLFSGLGIEGAKYTPSTGWKLHPGRTAEVTADGVVLGYVGELDPFEVDDHIQVPHSSGKISAFELNAEHLRVLAATTKQRKYSPLPKFPAVTRDIALVYDLTVTYGAVEETVKSTLGELLESVQLLSVYTGDKIANGKKSIAVRLTLRSKVRTLNESDAEIAVTSARDALTADLQADQR